MRRQAQSGTGLVNFGQVLVDLCLGSRQRFLRPIVLLTAFSGGPEQLLCPIEVNLRQCQRRLIPIESGDASVQKGYLVVEILHGALQFPALPSASIPRASALAACRSASAVSTAALF